MPSIHQNILPLLYPFNDWSQSDIFRITTDYINVEQKQTRNLQKAENEGRGVREATWDDIKGQGVKRQGEVFWILHVHMDMRGDSAFWGSAATQVILPTA